MSEPSPEQAPNRGFVANLPVVLVAAAIVLVAIANHHRGHDWGDDFSLYLHQGTSLIDGGVRDVIAENEWTLANSSWHSFSPKAYPWGWPLIVAPVYAVFGLDYHAFKAVEAVLFGGFLIAWFAITRRRVGDLAGFALMLVIGCSTPYIGWTDTVVSEFSYLCAIGLSWWWYDRCRERGAFETGDKWPLVMLGVVVAFAFSVRREGSALFLALAFSDVVRLAPRIRRAGLRSALRRYDWERKTIPYLSGFIFVAVLQLVLPSQLFPRYDGAGLSQLGPNISWYRMIVFEQFGLKTEGYPEVELLGSHGLAIGLAWLLIGAAVVGLAVRIRHSLSTDGFMIGYVVLAGLSLGIQPFHEGRYLFAISPLIVYFAYCGLRAALGLAPSMRRSAPWIATAFVAVFIAGNAEILYHRTDYRIAVGDYMIWGPEDPAAQELFDEIDTTTEPDAVISFFRARSMNFYSERRAVQLTNVDDLKARADYYAMEKGSDYSQVLLTDADAATAGFTKVWENSHFILWKIAP